MRRGAAETQTGAPVRYALWKAGGYPVDNFLYVIHYSHVSESDIFFLPTYIVPFTVIEGEGRFLDFTEAVKFNMLWLGNDVQDLEILICYLDYQTIEVK